MQIGSSLCRHSIRFAMFVVNGIIGLQLPHLLGAAGLKFPANTRRPTQRMICKSNNDRLTALVLSCISLALACYAIVVDSHSQLAPRSFLLQGFLGITLVLVSGIGFISTLTLLFSRKSLVYLIPCCGWGVASFRLFLLWA